MKKPWYKDFNVWTVIGETICGILAFSLIIISFFIPPIGIIDRSILAAVGEVFAFAALWLLPAAIRAGKTIKFTHGNTSVQVSGESQNE